MDKNAYILLLGIITTHTVTTQCTMQECLHKTKSFFTRTLLEKVDQKELSAESIKRISIDNVNGPVTIKTGPQKLLVVKTISRAKKQTDLDNIEVVIDSNTNDHLAIATVYNGAKTAGSVEYELIVPTAVNIALTITGNGDACIKDVHGIIDVVANDTITITNAKKIGVRANAQKGIYSH